MNFKPMSKQQLKNLLTEGNYEFEVMTATEKQSKSGNNMIALSLKVKGHNKDVHFINDWLLQPQDHEDADNVKNKIWKIRSFCYATGMVEKYEKGTLTEQDCLNKKGMAKIKVRVDNNGDEVNSIGYYIEAFNQPLTDSSKAKEKIDTASSTHKDSFLDDDLPF